MASLHLFLLLQLNWGIAGLDLLCIASDVDGISIDLTESDLNLLLEHLSLYVPV